MLVITAPHYALLQNERGISALGIAVGFNRLEMVKLFIAKRTDLTFRDPKKNTLMHYAAGELSGLPCWT